MAGQMMVTPLIRPLRGHLLPVGEKRKGADAGKPPLPAGERSAERSGGRVRGRIAKIN
jgi:hypothetical protein